MVKKRKLFWSILVLFLLIQVYPVSLPDVIMDNPKDLFESMDIPENIAIKLRTSCYDCHSNETKYPWYSYVAPVKWLVISDVKNAREELNFSEWDTLNKEDKAEILDDIATLVIEEEMPLKIYPIMHPGAKLDHADREAISEWAELVMEELFE